MGIEGILKSLMGKHSKSGAGSSAPMPKLPAVDSKTKESYKEVSSALGQIRKDMRELGDSPAAGKMEKLAKQARKLQPLQKAIQDVTKAEREWNKAIKDSKTSIHDQMKALDKLAAAKQKQVQIGNEQAGVMGRIKNVAASMGKLNIAMMAFSVIGRDVVLLSKQSDEAFNVMARTGQALGKNFSELSISAGKYAYSLNHAAIAGALAGHSGAESKKAFQELTRTFGGTEGAVANVSKNFGTLATVAKFSGMSIGDAALYADKNFARLGKTLRSSMTDIAQMGANTQNLNDLFGAGKVDTMEYAQTVSDLSFQSGNYNQNTKFLIESLNRELAVQFALGKSRDAAMDAAKKNLTKAGKANLVGTKRIGQRLQAEFSRGAFEGEEGEALAKERFGAQHKMVLQILKQGVGTGNNLIALHEIMQNSTEMQGELQKEIRRDAAAGGDFGMATEVNTMGQQLVLKLEEGMIAEKIGDIRGAKKEDRKGINDSLKELFEGVNEIKDPERKAKAWERVSQYARDIRTDPEMDAREEYANVIKAVMPDKQERDEDPLERFLHAVEGAGFIKMISAVNHIPGLLMGLPTAIAVAIAFEEASEMGILDMLMGKDPLDDGTVQQVIKTRHGPRNKYTEEQLTENRAKAKRKRLGERYRAGKREMNIEGKMGRAEVQGKTEEQFIEEHMNDPEGDAAGKAVRAEMFAKSPAELEAIAAGGTRQAHLAKIVIADNKKVAEGHATALAPTAPALDALGMPSPPGRELEGQFGVDGEDVIVRIPGAKKEFQDIAAETDLEKSAHDEPQ